MMDVGREELGIKGKIPVKVEEELQWRHASTLQNTQSVSSTFVYPAC